MNGIERATLIVTLAGLLFYGHLEAGTPDQLLLGEAPVLFTGAEGEDADTTLLLDGQPIRGDELWVKIPERL